jgi:dihydrolipoamide dehydrogenase
MVVGDVTTAVDLLILGAGPGGYVAALRAAQLGRKVTLVDASELGGACLHHACIPLKALLAASERFADASSAELANMGIYSNTVTFDWHQMQTWKQSIVQRLALGVSRLLKAGGVEYIRGTGWFINDREVRVEGEHGSLRFKFDDCIIATGAQAISNEGLLADGQAMLTPEQALALDALPEQICIAGDDYIALELATLFARLHVRVKLYTPDAYLLADCDPTLLRPVQAAMRKQGITITSHTVASAIQERPLILSSGTRPRVAELHLDAAGIALHASGGIAVDSQQRTNQPHIFAVGDCLGGPALASRAIKQGKIAAEVSSGQRVQFAPVVTPRVIHTSPEIAIVGLSDVAEAGYDKHRLLTGRFPAAANGRSLTLGADNGLTQLIADADGTLLGATLVGPRSGELSGQLALALEMGATLTDLSEILYTHPGLGETILEAAEQAQGKAIHIGRKA